MFLVDNKTSQRTALFFLIPVDSVHLKSAGEGQVSTCRSALWCGIGGGQADCPKVDLPPADHWVGSNPESFSSPLLVGSQMIHTDPGMEGP